MNLKKIMAIAVSVMLSVGALAGCSSTPAGDSSTSGAESAGDTKTIASAADLQGARVGVQEGTTGDIYVSEEIEGVEVSRFKRALDAVMDLQNGRLDAVVIDDLVAENLIASNEGLKILPEELTKEEYAIAVNKGNTELQSQINEALKTMEADGTIETIYNAFVQEDEAALQELQAKPEPSGDSTLTMATNAEFPPFEYKDDAGNITGYDIEIAKEIARQLNMSLAIEDMAFDSLIVALTSGKADMVIAGMTVTEERQQNVDFSDNYYEATQVIIVNE